MKLSVPQLPAVLDDVERLQLTSDDIIEASRILSIEVAHPASNVSFDECELLKPQLAQAKLEKLQLQDVRINGGDLTATNVSDAGMVRVTIQNTRMTGFDGSRATYKDVLFKGCKLDMANFRFAKFRTVRFEDCTLVDCDFQSAEFTNVFFVGCRFERVQLSNIRAKKVDLRDSELLSIIGWQSAAGVTISSEQLMYIAPELAHELKITVSDE